MAYILVTIMLWTIFGLLTPWRDWRRYYPTLIFSALLGTICDLMGVVFDQWAYYGPTLGALSLWSDLGIAPAEGGLFVRLFPKRRKPWLIILYLLGWGVFNAWWEWFFVLMGWIGYDKWNPLRAGIFYFLFFGLVGIQEYWYNGTDKLRQIE